ncbi:hypothetical protein [Pseudomonas sp. PA15(2017)]|uniref:GAF domain-containing protein n=1 Tax=Pseudomonas sp. PA15(2017) TaxID=1932111 RepID=UPI002115B270|nr:hypothetical protein [Pseudomonas sp. PA15(2017)]
MRSLVMVPIGRPVPSAALGAYWSDVRDHHPDTIERLESLARLATIAIENARLTQARNREVAIGNAQKRILELAVEEAPLNVTLDAIVREVDGLSVSGFMGSILLLDEAWKRLEHCAGPGLPCAYKGAVNGIAVAPSAVTAVADISNDPSWPNCGTWPWNRGCKPAVRSLSVRRRPLCSARSCCITANAASHCRPTSKSSISRCIPSG